MRVLLFRPNNPLMEATPIPLGLGYIAGALRKERRDTIEIIDCRKLRWSIAAARQKIRDFKPDVIGITVINFDSKSSHELAAGAKAEFPEVPILMGGPYASANREALLDDANVDVALAGEGEATIVELLNTIEAGESLETVKGIIIRKDGETFFTGPREPIADIDTLEMAWDLLDPPSYYGMKRNQNLFKKDPRALLIFTSRGCPYSCIFCHNIFGKKFRPRSPKSVLDEIEMLIDKYDCRELEIIDDTFSQDLERAKQICRGIIDRNFNLNLMLPNGIRADRTDGEFFDLLRDSGFFRVTFAVESASPRVQKIIKKNINLDKVKWAIEEVTKRGMLATGFFILGFPTETYEEMRVTANWAADSDLHIASFFYLKPFPGTEVAAMVPDDFSDVNLDDYNALSTVNLSAATDQELFSANKYAYRHFYLSPRRMARIAKIVPKNFRTLINASLILRLLVQDLRKYK